LFGATVEEKNSDRCVKVFASYPTEQQQMEGGNVNPGGNGNPEAAGTSDTRTPPPPKRTIYILYLTALLTVHHMLSLTATCVAGTPPPTKRTTPTFYLTALLTVHYMLSLTATFIAGRKLSAQLDGDDLNHLVALRDEDAPLETMEDWHLRMSEGVPEAAKFYAHKGQAARKVCIPNEHSVLFLTLSQADLLSHFSTVLTSRADAVI
jgi:hypothetical protein